MTTITNFTSAVILFAPIMLWLSGLIPSKLANKIPKLISRSYSIIAWMAFGSSLLVTVAWLFDNAHSWTLFSYELPGDIGAFSISTYVNTVTVIMFTLVSFVGAIVTRYACNYLDGDPQQGRFHKWLSLTLASILTLIVSGNLLMFSLAWFSTSLCLHQLLMFYKARPAAVLAAHKKFIASRIGDVSLLAAILLIGANLNTLEFEKIFSIMSTADAPLPPALQWASWLIILSAVLKSAQFPFHGWLIQVMEAPTPVSALLHAGIVNAGAFLVIRMSPIVSHSPSALGMLAIVGLITLALASLVMLTQTSIKVSLAWSTTAQMGFMLLECGLGLYSLAMLHLVAHSLYKAHAFLSSGSGVDSFRAPHIGLGKRQSRIWQRLAPVSLAVFLTVIIGAAFGIDISQQPVLLAAGVVVAIAMAQFLTQATILNNNPAFMLRAAFLTTVVCVAYFILHHAFEVALVDSVVPAKEASYTLQLTLAIVTIFVFIGLFSVQQLLKSENSYLHEKLYVHLYNGLYIDVYITRILQRIWPAPLTHSKYSGGLS